MVTEDLNQGVDTVQASISFSLGVNVENMLLTGTGNINGTGNELNNTLLGNAAANKLMGGAGADIVRGDAGDDTLDGGAGNDSLFGGLGNDTYVVDSTADVMTEQANEGTDLVNSSMSWTLGAHVENLSLIGTAAINGTGNELNNVLTGNSGGNQLTGMAGADILDGKAGADTLVGGLGDDTYIIDNTGDVVTENLNQGVDTVQARISFSLGANVENLTLTGTANITATGNSLSNVLIGTSGNNTLTGAEGHDTLNGGAGTDTLVGGVGNDTYIMDRGFGADLIQETDPTANNTDVLHFLSGISNDQLWFRQVSNNLEVSVIGTSDKATVQNWYLGSQYHVEQFKKADGKTLLDSQVHNLVNAMAGFAPPAAGQTSLSAPYQTSLMPIIAANWQG